MFGIVLPILPSPGGLPPPDPPPYPGVPAPHAPPPPARVLLPQDPPSRHRTSQPPGPIRNSIKNRPHSGMAFGTFRGRLDASDRQPSLGSAFPRKHFVGAYATLLSPRDRDPYVLRRPISRETDQRTEPVQTELGTTSSEQTGGPPFPGKAR